MGFSPEAIRAALSKREYSSEGEVIDACHREQMRLLRSKKEASPVADMGRQLKRYRIESPKGRLLSVATCESDEDAASVAAQYDGLFGGSCRAVPLNYGDDYPQSSYPR